MAWFYLQKIQNPFDCQFEAKRSQSKGLCECHKLLLMLIWKYNICKPDMFSQICCTKVCLDNISTCWNWSNDVFYPKVHRRTCHPALLLIDNALESFKAFQRENVVVCYFTPNVTSWKQPCDLGVIAAAKNIYLMNRLII